MKETRELTEVLDTRFDSATPGTLLAQANPHDKLDQLFREERLGSANGTITEEQLHDMYIRYLMKRLEGCQYGEFNGNPVIGLDKVKWAYELDLKLDNMSSQYEGFDVITATSKTGDSYLFHVESSTMQSALERMG